MHNAQCTMYNAQSKVYNVHYGIRIMTFQEERVENWNSNSRAFFWPRTCSPIVAVVATRIKATLKNLLGGKVCATNPPSTLSCTYQVVLPSQSSPKDVIHVLVINFCLPYIPAIFSCATGWILQRPCKHHWQPDNLEFSFLLYFECARSLYLTCTLCAKLDGWENTGVPQASDLFKRGESAQLIETKHLL